MTIPSFFSSSSSPIASSSSSAANVSPAVNSLRETVVWRKITSELEAIREDLSRSDRLLSEAKSVQEWLKKYEEFHARPSPLRVLEPSQVQQLFVASLEEILMDSEKNSSFPQVFYPGENSFKSALAKRMTDPLSIFFSERLSRAKKIYEVERQISLELQEINKEIDRSDPASPEVQGVQILLRSYQDARSDPELNPLVLRQQFIALLERILRNPWDEEGGFSPILFSAEAPPLLRFLVGKMRDPDSQFFSQKIVEAEEQELMKRMRLIEADEAQKREQELAMEMEGMDLLDDLMRRLEKMEEEEEIDLQALREHAQGELTQIGRDIEEARLENLQARENLAISIEASRQQLNAGEEEIAGLKEAKSRIEVQIIVTKEEQAKFSQAAAQLDKAIDARNDAKEGATTQLLFTVAAMAISWGLHEVYKQMADVAFQMGKGLSGTPTFGPSFRF